MGKALPHPSGRADGLLRCATPLPSETDSEIAQLKGIEDRLMCQGSRALLS